METVRCCSRLEKLMAFERLTKFVGCVDEDDAVARIDATARCAGIDPEAIVDREIMTAEELKNLMADPLARLGAHTVTHPNLARVTAERLKHEMELSAACVADYSDRKPKAFCYPYGGRHAVGSREASAAKESGFAVGVTTQPGTLSRACIQAPMLLPRVSLNGHFQKKRYVRALLSGLPSNLISSISSAQPIVRSPVVRSPVGTGQAPRMSA
jgi:hypothetical protein